jgi:hypothetical protein
MSNRDLPLLWCGAYTAGHDAHWIQAIHGAHDHDNPAVNGLLIDVHDNGTLVVDVDGAVHRLWHHQPERLKQLVARNDGAIMWQSRWSLLRTLSVDGWFVFSVCGADDRCPCPDPDEPPPNDLLELIEKRGGFDLPVDDALALLSRVDESGQESV